MSFKGGDKLGLFDFFKQRSQPTTVEAPFAPFNMAAINIDGVTALNCPPYMSAVTLLSTSLAKLGKHVMKDGQRVENHPIEKLLNEPNPFIDGYTMFLQAETQRLNDGNAYIHITRKDGVPTALMLIDQGNVSLEVLNSGFTYKVATSQGSIQVSPNDMIHVRSPQLDSNLQGIGYHAILKEQLKLWLAAQKHQTNYFQLGAFPKAMLQTTELLDPEAKKVVREEWEKLNGNDNKHRVAVLDGKFDYKHLGTNFDELEMNDMYGELTKQIASAFNLAPYLIGHDGSKNTYSNIESQNMQFLQNALMPGLTAWEYQLKKLCTNGDYVRFNIDTLLRADSSSRAERLSKLVQAKIISIDEARQHENLPPATHNTVEVQPIDTQTVQ